ncbi:PhzF family phenazine biosynthesis protein [Alteromonadaceae bacterium M269]|nr:PhzF family phenazine biosynthesis protein [Alteromonadaceae bacterium M269]
MRVPLYQVNAFTQHIAGGNPAGVCPLTEWLSDKQMQAIAKENNFSETAFFVKNGDRYDLRWFTPGCEVDLCGHATLATTKVLAEELGEIRASYDFNTRSGLISVVRTEDHYLLNMPVADLVETECPKALVEAIGYQPSECFFDDDYLLVFDQLNVEDLTSLEPDFASIKPVACRGVIVTCRSDIEGLDFVSRWFGSADVGIDEDPVTGSAHCLLTSYWAKRLNKNVLQAKQTSSRGGLLTCELEGQRVFVSGQAVVYMKGEIRVS